MNWEKKIIFYYKKMFILQSKIMKHHGNIHEHKICTFSDFIWNNKLLKFRFYWRSVSTGTKRARFESKAEMRRLRQVTANAPATAKLFIIKAEVLYSMRWRRQSLMRFNERKRTPIPTWNNNWIYILSSGSK